MLWFAFATQLLELNKFNFWSVLNSWNQWDPIFMATGTFYLLGNLDLEFVAKVLDQLLSIGVSLTWTINEVINFYASGCIWIGFKHTQREVLQSNFDIQFTLILVFHYNINKGKNSGLWMPAKTSLSGSQAYGPVQIVLLSSIRIEIFQWVENQSNFRPNEGICIYLGGL